MPVEKSAAPFAAGLFFYAPVLNDQRYLGREEAVLRSKTGTVVEAFLPPAPRDKGKSNLAPSGGCLSHQCMWTVDDTIVLNCMKSPKERKCFWENQVFHLRLIDSQRL